MHTSLMEEVVSPTFDPGDSATYLPLALIVHTREYVEWAEIGHVLEPIGRGYQWWYGDWMVQGESLFGESASQEFPTLADGFDPHTVKQWKYVANAVARERRTSLPWSYHACVASLSPDQQTDVMERCISGEWTRDQLRSVVESVQAGEPIPDNPPDVGPRDPLAPVRQGIFDVRGVLLAAIESNLINEVRDGVRTALDMLDELTARIERD